MKNKLFTDVYNKYHRLVIKAALDQTGDFELAQEICQHVFWKYYDNMDTVAPDFIKAWLLITAKRAIIDNSRKASVRREVIMPTTSMNTAVQYSIDELVNRTANTQLLFTIFDDLKQMNERWYEVIYQSYVNGLTQEEAAAKLGIAVTVFRARLCRAKKYIRQKYLKDDKEK